LCAPIFAKSTAHKCYPGYNIGYPPNRENDSMSSPIDLKWLSNRAIAQFKLDEQLLEKLKAIYTIKKWNQGEVIASYGKKRTSIGIALSGKIKIMLNSIDGNSYFIRYMEKGEIYGVPSVLIGAPFPTDMICEENATIIEINESQLKHLLQYDNEFNNAIIYSLSTRVTEMFDFLENDLLPTLREKVYQRLLRLSQFNGIQNRKGNIELNITQEDIAQSIKASRPKVHHELKRLEKEGIIALGYKKIIIKKL